MPEILGKFQECEGGGIFHAGAAVPARLTPPRLCGARLLRSGGSGLSRPALRQHIRRLPAQYREVPRQYLHNKSGDPILDPHNQLGKESAL
ncbi:hypothetical protein KUCAC02_002834 [Chaenocephalus aceratus]|uniref:Uncharacterized protein n=1 Tax=Chaenocephalus aceratus TaxID=36190 RepID=A0ACB9WJQ9_CHAAC|nr:hypothetical protein KUCAC02_002834 [Chaenocephalus aceratus]